MSFPTNLIFDFGIVSTVWYFQNCIDSVVFLELYRKCGIFLIVSTVWYFQNCIDSVVFLELYRQWGIFLIASTVWYFQNCIDSVVFSELYRQCGIFRIVSTVWYFLFFILLHTFFSPFLLAHPCELLPSLGVRRPSSVCKMFQKSSPLKPLGQFKTNLA